MRRTGRCDRMTAALTRARGFTLIELMVTIAVLGVIVMVAYPAYLDFVERGRRSEATEALQNAATLQEKFYNHNKEYTDDMSDLGMSPTTGQGYYHLTITVTTTVDGSPQGYRLDASARGAQTGDTDCPTIQMDSAGNKTPTDCW